MRLIKVIEYVLLVLFSLSLLGVIFFINYPIKPDPFVVISGSLLLLLSIVFCANSLRNVSEVYLEKICLLVSSTFFIFLIGFSQLVTSERPLDLFFIHEAAKFLYLHGSLGNLEYFEIFPHQIPLAYLTSFVYKIGKFLCPFAEFRTIGAIWGSICIFISISCLASIIQTYSNTYTKLLFLLAVITCPIFYFYSSFYYTDIVSAAFVCLGLKFYFTNDSKSLWKYVLVGICLALGTIIRTTAIFAFFAVMVCSVLNMTKGRESWRIIFIIVLAFVCLTLSYKFWESIFVIYDRGRALGIPFFFMIGLDPAHLGAWWDGHYEYVVSVENLPNKTQLLISRIFDNLSQADLPSIIWLFGVKLFRLLSWGYSDSFTQLFISREYGDLYDFAAGNRLYISAYYAFFHRFVLLFFVCTAIWQMMKRQLSNLDIFLLLYVGLYIAFYLVWESSARYILPILPVLYLFAVLSISKFCKGIYKCTSSSCYLFIHASILCAFIFSFGIFLHKSVDFYGNETAKNVPKVDWVARSVIYDRKVVLNEEYTQSFVSDKNFNTLKVWFDSSNIQNQIYGVKLNNSLTGESLTYYFNTDNLIDGVLLLPVKGTSGSYTFTIFPANRYPQYLQLFITDSPYLDRYDSGYLTPSRTGTSDMMFEIFNFKEEPRMTTRGYKFLIFVLILVYLVIFYGIVVKSVNCLCSYNNVKRQNN